LFLAKCLILVVLGVLSIGIQNSYVLQVRYEPHLSDNARCPEASLFSIRKIRYVCPFVAPMGNRCITPSRLCYCESALFPEIVEI